MLDLATNKFQGFKFEVGGVSCFELDYKAINEKTRIF